MVDHMLRSDQPSGDSVSECFGFGAAGPAPQSAPGSALRSEGLRSPTNRRGNIPRAQDNLEPDLEVWRQKRPGSSTPLLGKDLLNLLHQIDTEWPESKRNVIALVMIKAQRVRWWAYPEARQWCKDRVEAICMELEKHAATGLYALPETVFVINAFERPLCGSGNCSTPIFSSGKNWGEPEAAAPLPSSSKVGSSDEASPSALLTQTLPRGSHDDILFPVMDQPFEQVVDYPWELKIPDHAFMRELVHVYN
eukprot:gene22313-29386_t